jgi:putative ATPase
VAINQALDDVRTSGSLDVPLHLRNAVTGLMKSMGYGKGYVYAHDDQRRAQKLDYLPDALRGRVYYEPSEQGTEAQLRKHLEKIRGASDSKPGAPQ